jgi:predicted DCC family thiol-disulfide oxidoreductase YuxK
MAHGRVSNPPEKPLVIFDGDCHFCRRWIERWRELTEGTVDYAPFQDAAARFSEIPREHFAQALHFIGADGTIYRGAEAVFRSLGAAGGARALVWSYRNIPGFGPVTEAVYRAIARNRMAGSFFTRLLWGKEVRRPTYFISRDLFLRSLGAIYLIAFLSLWMQIDGLVGEHGILPVGQHLKFAREQLGSDAFFLLPTLCWFNSSKAFLHFMCGAGPLAEPSFHSLPLPDNCRPDFPQFPVGHPAARSGLSRHFSGAVSLATEVRHRRAILAGGILFAQVPSL